MAARGGGYPDVQTPGVLVGHRLQDRENVALRSHRLFGIGQEKFSLIGELHLGLPLEQFAAALGLQPGDVAAEILLGEKQPVGGLSKVQILCRLGKIVQTDGIQSAALPLLISVRFVKTEKLKAGHKKFFCPAKIICVLHFTTFFVS